MGLFDVLNLIGGLCLFLFGMNLMGEALERRTGSGLRTILSKLTTKKSAGFLTGLAVTSVIQSSSATTVMVVGFVNSGLLALNQAINVIMGANVGTTVTAWLLSLGGIESDVLWVQLLKPTSFTPVLALVGIIFTMFFKSQKKKDTGVILLAFATLMFGMDTMSASVSGLKDVPEFQQLFVTFSNPILGVLAGAILTAIIQSSSASVGILQALSATGAVSMGAAIPIIMGQNIGTCITAILSSFGTNKNAKRAALVHLSFNVIGTVVWLILFCIAKALFEIPLLGEPASEFLIAVAHSAFNIACTLLLLPMSKLLEKLALTLIPETKTPEKKEELDERLLATPSVALQRCHEVSVEMAEVAVATLKEGIESLTNYSPELAESVREKEDRTDHYEDILGSYLVKLSTLQISESDSAEAAMLLKVISDFERISDHGVNILESAEEMRDKDVKFSESATKEIKVLAAAVDEILDLSLKAFKDNDAEAIAAIEPLEQVIDGLKEQLRTNHILRLQQGNCTIETGFVWTDLLTNFERTGDHCSNIAGCILDFHIHNMNIHENVRAIHSAASDYQERYEEYNRKYTLA
ncbi:MAG: Na/Pi cotransporter family protein [Clostridia bacterium]|nr:Na/Pi cotransporter family protein [Clostridia bacterium]